MRLKSLIAIVLTAFLLVISEGAEAQRKSKYQKRRAKNRTISHYKGGRVTSSRFREYSYAGVTVNAMNYFGDLAPVNKNLSSDISFTRPGFGIFYGRKFHHSLAWRASFNYGRLIGEDFSADPTGGDGASHRYERNLSFRNDIKELSGGLEISLFPNYGGPQSRPLVNGYAYIGLAVFHHEPKGKVPDADYQTDLAGGVAAPQAGEWVKLRPLGTEGQNYNAGKKYSPFQLAVPIALGGEVFVKQQLSVGLEFGFRYLFFDYLDDASGRYYDLGAFNDNDVLARIMSDRSAEPRSAHGGKIRQVNPVHITQGTFDNGEQYYHNSFLTTGKEVNNRRGTKANDMYFMTQLKVTYIFSDARRGRAKRR